MKKRFIFRRRTPMTLMEMANNCVGFERPKKRGKALKHATMILAYSASVKRTVEVTGLSLRRVRALQKALIRGNDPLNLMRLRSPTSRSSLVLKSRTVSPIELKWAIPQGYKVNRNGMLNCDTSRLEKRVMESMVERTADEYAQMFGCLYVTTPNPAPLTATQVAKQIDDANRKLGAIGTRFFTIPKERGLRPDKQFHDEVQYFHNYGVLKLDKDNISVAGFNVCT